MSMFNIVPLIVILFSLSVIIVIVVRKFSALASLDVDNIPAEKEAKFKEKLISERLKRGFLKWNFKIQKTFSPILSSTGKGFSWSYDKLKELKERHSPQKNITEIDYNKKITDLYNKVDELLKDDNLLEAEKNLIEIIGINSKELKAFKMLADLYFEKKSFEEARQTYDHVLRLIEDEIIKLGEEVPSEIITEKAEINFDMALVCKELEDKKRSMDCIKNALKIEPNNPRFLDTLLEISIINKEKEEASLAFDKLKKADPENKKLVEIEERIKEL